MYAVGAHQQVGCCHHAVLEPGFHLVAVLADLETAMREMHPLRGHGPGQRRMQLAAMKDVVRRTKLGFDRLSERRAGERAAILPPTLVEERRPERDLGQLRAKAETDQQ